MPIDVETSPPLITGVKIDHHPFEDLVPTRDEDVPWKKKGGEGVAGDRGGKQRGKNESDSDAVKKRRKKRKGKRDLNLLSFGDEEKDLDGGAGMESSHDALADEKSEFLSLTVDDAVRRRAVAEEDRSGDVVNPGNGEGGTRKRRHEQEGGKEDPPREGAAEEDVLDGPLARRCHNGAAAVESEEEISTSAPARPRDTDKGGGRRRWNGRQGSEGDGRRRRCGG